MQRFARLHHHHHNHPSPTIVSHNNNTINTIDVSLITIITIVVVVAIVIHCLVVVAASAAAAVVVAVGVVVVVVVAAAVLVIVVCVGPRRLPARERDTPAPPRCYPQTAPPSPWPHITSCIFRSCVARNPPITPQRLRAAQSSRLRAAPIRYQRHGFALRQEHYGSGVEARRSSPARRCTARLRRSRLDVGCGG